MTLSIDVISDVICPWCYIGKRRLEKAVAALAGTRPAGVGWQPNTGWGLVNAARALEMATGQSATDRVIVNAPYSDASPRAGKRFTVQADADWQDGLPLDTGSARCTATLAGGHPRSVVGSLSLGVASCTFLVPAGTSHKRMTIDVIVHDIAGNIGTNRLSVRVR